VTIQAPQRIGFDSAAITVPSEGPGGLLARQFLRAVADARHEELPALVGALAQAHAAAFARLVQPVALAPEAASPVRLVGLEEAERLTGMTRRWLLRHTKGLRFRRDLSRKAVRFEEAGLLRWLRCRA
jgi:predicted DNA-binding transcriptional regulator AlpA